MREKDGIKSCVKCKFENDSCIDCKNNNICKKCKPGFTLREFRSELEEDVIKVGCLQCPTEDGCATCADNECKTCQKGFFLKDG